MDVRKELFKAITKLHILMKDDNGESPYLYPFDDLERIVVELAGISEEEYDKIANEAVDYAWEICHMLKAKGEE